MVASKSKYESKSSWEMLSQASAFVSLPKITLAKANHLSETYVRVRWSYRVSWKRT